MRWTANDFGFDLVAEITEHPVVTADITTPAGTLRVMAEPEIDGRVLVLRGFNVESGRQTELSGPTKPAYAGAVRDGEDGLR